MSVWPWEGGRGGYGVKLGIFLFGNTGFSVVSQWIGCPVVPRRLDTDSSSGSDL